MKVDTTAERLYLELTILLIEYEISRFRRGEQTALASFTKMAKLARNATKEFTPPERGECTSRSHACGRARPNEHVTKKEGAIWAGPAGPILTDFAGIESLARTERH